MDSRRITFPISAALPHSLRQFPGVTRRAPPISSSVQLGPADKAAQYWGSYPAPGCRILAVEGGDAPIRADCHRVTCAPSPGFTARVVQRTATAIVKWRRPLTGSGHLPVEDSVAVQSTRYQAGPRRRSAGTRGRSGAVECFHGVPCNPLLPFLAGSHPAAVRRGTWMDFPSGETCIDIVGTIDIWNRGSR
jgi:hypothetical protein